MGLKRIGVTKPEFKRLYLSEKLNIYQIAKILCCHPATVGKRLHEYQIPIKRPTEKLLIDEETLENLYVSRKLSIYKIADFLGCSVRSISTKMKKYGIKGRSTRKENINKKTLLRLYHQERLSLKEIGNLYRMSPSGILKRMRKFNLPVRNSWEANIIHTKKPFSESSEEKAYLIGFRIGDLGVRLSSKRTNNIRVNSNTTKKEQADLIRGLFRGYSDVWISKPNKRNMISTSTILHPSFAFLLPKYDLIEKWIVADSGYMSAFVAGYVDAEGSFGIYDNRGRFRLGSYDKGILGEINAWFKSKHLKVVFCLERKQGEKQNQDFWRLIVNERKSLLSLYRLIYSYMRHKKRLADFDHVKDNVLSRLQGDKIQAYE